MNAVLFAAFALSATPEFSPRARLAVEAHGALLNSGSGAPLVAPSFGWALRGGLSGEQLGVFLHAGQSLWHGVESGAVLRAGVFNVGLGVELRFAQGLVRSSLAVGPSVLLFATPLDPAGRTGLFVEARPLGLRWALDRGLTLGFDPLSFALAAPALAGLPLVRLQFNTTLVLEFDFR